MSFLFLLIAFLIGNCHSFTPTTSIVTSVAVARKNTSGSIVLHPSPSVSKNFQNSLHKILVGSSRMTTTVNSEFSSNQQNRNRRETGEITSEKNTIKQNSRIQTSIEKANETYKEKRLKERMDRLLRKVQMISDSDRGEKAASSSSIQKLCDELLGICAASDQWTIFEDVIEIMKQRNISLQASSFRSCLRECDAAGNGSSSSRIFEMMQSQNNSLETGDIDLIIGALCKQNEDGESWRKALVIIGYAADNNENMNGKGVKIESYNAILSNMEHGKHWEDAMSLLAVMEDEDIRHPYPNIATYHAVLNVLIASNQLETASNLLLSLSEPKQDYIPKPSTYTFEIVLAALTRNDHRGSNYKQAISVLETMISLCIPVPVEMYNRVISSCAKAKKANLAIDIFSKMKGKKVIPDAVTYNTLISACANEGMTDEALKLFNECRKEGNCQPDVITYTNTIRACGSARMSKKALNLLVDAKKNSIPLDVFIYTALIDGKFFEALMTPFSSKIYLILYFF